MVLSKEDFSMMLGAKIRELRKRKGLTMQQLANEVGIEYIQLSRIERGKINTTIYQVYIIYNFFGESIDFLAHSKLFMESRNHSNGAKSEKP